MDFAKMFGKKKSSSRGTDTAPGAESAAGGGGADSRTLTREEIEQAVIDMLRSVYDPEIPVNIYELGLVYEVDAEESGKVLIRMTLTSPGCPVAGSLIPEIETKARAIPGVKDAKVLLVWDPPWDPDMMSEAAKLQLGIF